MNKKVILISLIMLTIIATACEQTQSPEMYDCQKQDINITRTCINQQESEMKDAFEVLRCVRRMCYEKIYG